MALSALPNFICKHCNVPELPCVLPCGHLFCLELLEKCRYGRSAFVCPSEECKGRSFGFGSNGIQRYVACYLCLQFADELPHSRQLNPDIRIAKWHCYDCNLNFCRLHRISDHDNGRYKYRLRTHTGDHFTHVELQSYEELSKLSALKHNDAKFIFNVTSTRNKLCDQYAAMKKWLDDSFHELNEQLKEFENKTGKSFEEAIANEAEKSKESHNEENNVANVPLQIDRKTGKSIALPILMAPRIIFDPTFSETKITKIGTRNLIGSLKLDYTGMKRTEESESSQAGCDEDKFDYSVMEKIMGDIEAGEQIGVARKTRERTREQMGSDGQEAADQSFKRNVQMTMLDMSQLSIRNRIGGKHEDKLPIKYKFDRRQDRESQWFSKTEPPTENPSQQSLDSQGNGTNLSHPLPANQQYQLFASHPSTANQQYEFVTGHHPPTNQLYELVSDPLPPANQQNESVYGHYMPTNQHYSLFSDYPSQVVQPFSLYPSHPLPVMQQYHSLPSHILPTNQDPQFNP